LRSAPGLTASLALLGAAMTFAAAGQSAPHALQVSAPGAAGAALEAGVPVYGYQIVHVYPHDTHAFTEGLFYLNGFLYESTGLEGQSTIRKVRLETGEVLQHLSVPSRYFGEGIVNWKQHLVGLTWKSQVGFVYDLQTFKLQRHFSYPGEGWALTQDGTHLIMSDGTDQLRWLDPQTLQETARLSVTIEGQPLRNLNELEWVKGEIFANVWQTNWIARIDPRSGAVVGLIDCRGLLAAGDVVPGQTDVLNGIAYDAQGDRLFITGKNWPKLFEIQLRRIGVMRPRRQ
jgi:glutaminyl-peptide cyclotransferase